MKEDVTDSFVKMFKYQKKAASAYAEFTKRIFKACANRRLFVTGKGYIGLAPWNAREGDVVAVLLGGKMPYLLRPRGSDCTDYTFVGETYVHGLMEGEAMDPDTDPTT